MPIVFQNEMKNKDSTGRFGFSPDHTMDSCRSYGTKSHILLFQGLTSLAITFNPYGM